MIKTQLILDMNRKSITPRINVKQLDSGRSVEITVNCDGILVTDTFDETRILTAKGEFSYFSSSLTENPIISNLENGKTIWQIPSDVISDFGITMGELRLLKLGKVVSSMPFEIYVEPVVSKGDAKTPESAVDFIERAENAAIKAEEEAENARNASMATVEEHNNSEGLGVHPDIQKRINESTAIAKGKARSLVFDTKAQLDDWLIEDEWSNVVFGVSGEATTSLENEVWPDDLRDITLPAGNYKIQISTPNNELSDIIAPVSYEIIDGRYALSLEEESTISIFGPQTASEYSFGYSVTIFRTPYIREDGKTPADLQIGDNLYVVELGVPDYWWDGQTAQELGAEKPDFSELVSKEELAAQFGGVALKSMTQSEYDAAYLAGTLDAGTIYFVYEDDIF